MFFFYSKQQVVQGKDGEGEQSLQEKVFPANGCYVCISIWNEGEKEKKKNDEKWAMENDVRGRQLTSFHMKYACTRLGVQFSRKTAV